MPAFKTCFTVRSLSVAIWCFSTALVVAQESTDGKTFTQKPEIASAAGRPIPATSATPTATAKSVFAEGTDPIWIWGPDSAQKYTLKTTFVGGTKSARLRATCDNSMTLFLNGEKIASSDNWEAPVELDIQKHVKPGENVLTAEVANNGGQAGFLLKVVLIGADGKARYVVSDRTWDITETTGEKKSVGFKVVGPTVDSAPWGKVFFGETAAAPARDTFNLLPGFQVEKLFTVPKEKLGSWVNITSDPKGRLIVSDQGNLGLCRITPAPIRTEPERASVRLKDETKVELLDIKIDGKQMSGAQGLLWAFDSLYVVCNGGPGSGLYRCRDTDGDDQFDKVEKLRDIPGGGEHGPHAIRLSPDGKSLYVAAGNHTKMPFEIKTNAPPQTMGGPRTEQLRATLPEGVTSRLMPNWDEDLLLPRQWDGGGHAVGILAPGGWICKIDPEGKTWDVFTSGYRNQFDFAFNADGEMFVYDADMEWDFGSPWYRPTRVVHATSGSEFGWRSGTGKWPSYYIDSLPELINIGPGSPVGIEFGYGTKFPAKYQKALYICDWTFGTMYAIHMEPSGSSYRATKEEFVSRTPLPLTDCTVGKDGALYFTIGGRGAQSELFRVTYVGKEDVSPVEARDSRDANLRNLRREIESWGNPAELFRPQWLANRLVETLGHPDRFIRYAARVSLERRNFVDKWKTPVLSATNADIVITGCVGLARQAEPAVLPEIVATLGKLDFAMLTAEQQLGLLRAYQLAFIRLGNPDKDTSAALAKKFDDLFPQKSDFVNRELSILMIHFQSPGAVKKLVPLLALDRQSDRSRIRQNSDERPTDSNPSQKTSDRSLTTSATGDGAIATGDLLSRNKGYGGTIAAMLANQPDQMQYHYAFHLRNLKTGWTLDDRKTYFAWFEKARTWSGGASYPKFLTNIDKEAFANCTDAERLAIEASGVRKPYVIPELPKPRGPGKDYTVDEVLALATDQLKGRDFKNGEKMYKAARCVVCHRFGGDGGATGPDLTQLAGRFNVKDLTDAIVDPSKIISDQFKASTIETKAGKIVTGQIVSESKDTITILVDPENATKTVEIKKSDIETNQPSKISLMPKDLLKALNEDEVRDLLAYLLSRGNPNDAMFRK